MSWTQTSVPTSPNPRCSLEVAVSPSSSSGNSQSDHAV
eukprot:CAMPEP_0197862332 /NCGR_PEP_ID=MMETSP1438-20131217/39017_1 /TAXON_ID=1461541 /ORGANISM="Pterosperma sp., Strain CCMP1384" /LENGTH=37 /DNA_ID= /DNA_START= /DNA_END= /DNA_ORIENTATION=